ncbi:hypothetical protein D9M71_390080 [compost metagenome]
MGTARHQVVTRTFRGSAGQDRRLDVEEAIFVQVAADAGGHARTQAQLLGHFRATQVNEAITQARLFTDVGVFVERERRGFRFVQYFQFIAQHFDSAGSHVGIAGTGRTQTHLAGNLDHVLAAYTVSCRESLGAIRVEHHLGQTFTVTNIEENHPAMVATAMNPSAKGNFLAFQAFVQLAAIMAAHHDSGFASRNRNSVEAWLAQWAL